MFGPADPTPPTVLRRFVAIALLTLVALLSGIATAPFAHAQSTSSTESLPGDPPAIRSLLESDLTAVATPGDPEVNGGGIVVPEVTFGDDDGGLSSSVSTILAFGIAAIAPTLVLLTTTFTRFIVVLSLLKNALALQTVPPSQVLVGLSLFLTVFTMGPVLQQVNDLGVQPMLNGEISQGEAFTEGFAPLKEFMLNQVRDEDLALFVELSGKQDQIEAREDVDAITLIPAFVTSELRTAFTIGFIIFVPFLMVDLVVAAVLMSMGMVMVPPVFISLPLKLLLFVLVDGWVLLIGALVTSVNMAGLL